MLTPREEEEDPTPGMWEERGGGGGDVWEPDGPDPDPDDDVLDREGLGESLSGASRFTPRRCSRSSSSLGWGLKGAEDSCDRVGI